MPDKYQEEIEEILNRVGELPAAPPGGDREKAPREKSAVLPPEQLHENTANSKPGKTRRWPSLSSGKLLLVGLLLLVVGAFSSLKLLIWVGLGMLVVAYLLFFIKPRSLSYDKYWRGRSTEDASSSLWNRFLRWLKS